MTKLTASGVDIRAHFLANSRADAVRVEEVEKFFNGVVQNVQDYNFYLAEELLPPNFLSSSQSGPAIKIDE